MTDKKRDGMVARMEGKIKGDPHRDRLHLVCQGMLLGFDKFVVHDLSIPDPYNITSLVKLACSIVSGEEVKPKAVNCVTTSHQFNPLTLNDVATMAKLYGQDDAEDFYLAVKAISRDSSSIMELELSNDWVYRHEWFFGRGDWYEFRTGKREEANQAVHGGLKRATIEHLLDLTQTFAPFVGLTNGSCKCESA